MNLFTFIKEKLFHTTYIVGILLMASCGNNQKAEDTKEVAEDQNEVNFDNNLQENDAQFLVNAAEINLEEIELGQLAQEKGKATHIKELGKMMEESHKKGLNDVSELANRKKISIPTSSTKKAKDMYETLNGKSGDDFDKAYADMMVKGHENAIAIFEKASTDGHDQDIKNWASATLPDLRTHLDHSVECQKKCNHMSSKKNN